MIKYTDFDIQLQPDHWKNNYRFFDLYFTHQLSQYLTLLQNTE